MRSASRLCVGSAVKKGDMAIVLGARTMSIRAAREEGTAKALEEAGVKVVRSNPRPEWASRSQPRDSRHHGGVPGQSDSQGDRLSRRTELGNAATYMKAAGKKPGEMINIGFDTSPQIVEAFKGGWVQLTADQQPFQQGYLPILSLCEQIVYGLAPINVDTGAGFVTPDNYKAVADLATEGLR